ncbi:hypothetical protein LUZ60_001891 [Juncus effusus]|nr:hypothetical protein LUZ60_001891 [Juncus effusus]
MSGATVSTAVPDNKKYKGVRQRQWGKWVSEIRVPGSKERLWLGSYSTAEAAAMAHDTAFFFLRGPGPMANEYFNFPDRVGVTYSWAPLSPPSVQRLASDAGMSTDAILTELKRMKSTSKSDAGSRESSKSNEFDNCLDGGFSFDEDFCIDDVEICM